MSPLLADGIERLRSKWPQAHAFNAKESDDRYAEHLVVVPGVLLPSGYNKTICTALFLAMPPVTNLTEFWIDLPDLLLSDGRPPRRSCVCGGPWDGCKPRWGKRGGIWDGIPGFPNWKGLRLFLWCQQHFNPNKETIFTTMMLVRERLRLAC